MREFDMKKAFAVLVLLLAPACSPATVTNYAAVSTHTLQVAADKQVDVVWLQQYRSSDGFALMRCYNAPEGPTCTRVKTP
jgi:hypothetical protein